MWGQLNITHIVVVACLVAGGVVDLLTNGTTTSEDLAKTYLARIAKINPSTRSFLEVSPFALEDARKRDNERRGTGVRSKMHGVPILVKEPVSIDGLNSSAGSYCLLGSRTRNEASVVARLRAAGATYLNGAAHVRSARRPLTAGVLSGGQTCGVYYREQDPCGSSSGSGVAVALGLAAGAVEVETMGSITCPAMRDNLVSIKTTSGLVPRDNVIVTRFRGPVGPMTRTVRDAAIMLNFVAGPTSEDPDTLRIPFSISLKLGGLVNSRLAVPRNNGDDPSVAKMDLVPVMEQFDGDLNVVRGLGARIIDDANYSSYEEINAADAPQGRVGPAEYRFDIERCFRSLAVHPYGIRTVEDLINCTKTLPKEEYPARDVAYWEQVVKSADFGSPEMTKEIERMRDLGGTRGIDAVIDTHKADAIVFPSVCSSDVPSLVGYPVVCVPLGFIPEGTEAERNTKRGFGGASAWHTLFTEKLIELAYAFEQHTQIGRQRKPVVLPVADTCDILQERRVVWRVWGKLREWFVI
ncbi:hypothetical protein QC762_605010 [Podospora pseudocomata]|uniref:Amidase domain-containing protein n=1 Tax=Podospora pseudocomata TaxID=2093779 RepID=A0ABR0G6F5_9PEZI|nr:hypothetical protein QC762_605010 [Podospora pseudocomata]